MPTATLPKRVLPQNIGEAADYNYVAQSLSRPHTEVGMVTLVHISPYILGASQAVWTATVNADFPLGELASLGISCVNPAAVRDYLALYTDLPAVVGQTTKQVRQALQDVRLSLELVYDPEDTNIETLVLYLHPTEVEPSLFGDLRRWNSEVAERMSSSEAWFVVNLDLRRQE